MAKIGYRKIKKAFKVEYGSSGNFIDFQEGKYVMAIPECDTETHCVICYEHSPFKLPNEYFSHKIYDNVNEIHNFKYSDLI